MRKKLRGDDVVESDLEPDMWLTRGGVLVRLEVDVLSGGDRLALRGHERH